MSHQTRVGRDQYARVVVMWKNGHSLQSVGDRFGVTRERIRQILRKLGVPVEAGGRHVKARVKEAERQSRRDAFALRKYGCCYADYKAISQSGGVVPFNSQRSAANSRGVKWKLNLKQWWDIWQQSGKWDQRGRGKNRYCMGRIADQGAYAIGNVKIITTEQNGRDYQFCQDRAAKRPRGGVYQLYPGLTRSWVAKHGSKTIGRYCSEAEALAAKIAYVDSLPKQSARQDRINAARRLMSEGIPVAVIASQIGVRANTIRWYLRISRGEQGQGAQ